MELSLEKGGRRAVPQKGRGDGFALSLDVRERFTDSLLFLGDLVASQRTRNRKFESISLQGRVQCEPDFPDLGSAAGQNQRRETRSRALRSKFRPGSSCLVKGLIQAPLAVTKGPTSAATIIGRSRGVPAPP